VTARAVAAAVPLAVTVPGEVETRAAIEAARAREADIALRIQAAELSRREALDARAELVARIATGSALPASGIAAATAAIAGAEETIALLQDALRQAEAATKQADRKLGEVLRTELRRRHPLLRAAADTALAAFLQHREAHSRLDVLAADVQRAAAGDKPIDDLEFMLAQSAAEVAVAGGAA